MPYFHVVFTLAIAAIAFCNRRTVFDILFRSVALRTIAADPRRHAYRRHRRPAHLGPEAALPSPSACRCASRRLRARQRGVEDRERCLPGSRQGSRQPVPTPLPRRTRPGARARSSSTATSPISPTPAGSTPPSPAAGTGWSMPKSPSGDRSKCSDTCPDIHTGSPSPTAASPPSTARPPPSGTESRRSQGRRSRAPPPSPSTSSCAASCSMYCGMHRIRHFGILANSCRASTVQRAREALGPIGSVGANEDRGEARDDQEEPGATGRLPPVRRSVCLPYPSQTPPLSTPRTAGCAAVNQPLASIPTAQTSCPPTDRRGRQHDCTPGVKAPRSSSARRQNPAGTTNRRLNRTKTATPPVRRLSPHTSHIANAHTRRPRLRSIGLSRLCRANTILKILDSRWIPKNRGQSLAIRRATPARIEISPGRTREIAPFCETDQGPPASRRRSWSRNSMARVRSSLRSRCTS